MTARPQDSRPSQPSHADSWQPPCAQPALPTDVIHIWRLRPEARFAPERYLECLQDDERDRAGRFHFSADQWQFLASRATLRLLLSRYLGGVPPRGLTLTTGEHGKPSLPGSGIDFNLSHTRDLAVFAFARQRELGIDVERVRAFNDLEETVKRNFAAVEVAALQSLPQTDKLAAFYRCWTRKEALLKADGSGLFRALDSFAVSLHPEEPARLLECAWGAADDPGWDLAHLDVLPDAVGAIAWRRLEKQPALVLFDCSPDFLSRHET